MPTSTPITRSTEPTTDPALTWPPAARLRRAVRRIQDWCVEANPMPRLRGPARSAFKPTLGVTSVQVQGELSLDGVKVVRNDLSDADLEIVPAKPARRADLAPLPEVNAWQRLTTRIFVRTERE